MDKNETLSRPGTTCHKCKKATAYQGRIICTSSDQAIQSEFSKYGRDTAERCKGFSLIKNESGSEIRLDKALIFMLAGRAEFIAQSGKTGKRIHLLIERKTSSRNNPKSTDEIADYQYIYWLMAFNGSSTKSNFLGTIYFNDKLRNYEIKLRKMRKDLLTKEEMLDIKSILFIINRLNKEDYNIPVKIFHVGKCGMCGRKLTDEQSIKIGLGPKCAETVRKDRALYGE